MHSNIRERVCIDPIQNKNKVISYTNIGALIIVSYLTPLSDLDLAPDTDQFVAFPPIRYINPGFYVNFFQHSEVVISILDGP